MAFPNVVVVVFLLACSASAISKEDDKCVSFPSVVQNHEWPGFPDLVQVAAVSITPDGSLQMFHRAGRVFDFNAFSPTTKVYKNISEGPITTDTILIVDSNTGEMIFSWGANMFYMPHGMTVDGSGNTWVTDLAFHQVLKYPAGEYKTPSLTIGQRFVPGSDSTHLCQPADVAVTPEGTFFIADGNCNSRVLMFDSNGGLLKEIGPQDGMKLPHSLALVPQHAAVCVCDRQNGRILCYNTGMQGTEAGKQLLNFDNLGLGTLYSIKTRGDDLFVVNGPDVVTHTHPVSSFNGFVLNLTTGVQKSMWGPDEGFLLPHDMTLAPDGMSAFVTDINVTAPKKVYKFDIYYKTRGNSQNTLQCPFLK